MLDLPAFPADPKGVATREASGKVLNAIAARVPWLIGGAGDLAPSTKTKLSFDGAGTLAPGEPGGRNLHFGVREHAMGAVVNGLVLSRMRAFGATFLIFSDYMRPPIRLAALMELPVFHVFTHDSIGVGEDGPTHQPIEQLAGLRAIPGMIVLRPADANEVREAYRVMFGLKHNPACLALSRQALPVFDRERYASAAGLARGAYVMADAKDGEPQVILIGTGSEVQLCVNVYEALAREGIGARVVSMPSWELFEQQDAAYRDSVLPSPHHGARRRRAGQCRRLGSLRGPRRRNHRDAQVRRVGTAQGPAGEIRLHRGKSDGRRQDANCQNADRKGKAAMNSVNALQKHGQAVWLDFLARGFMVDGGLQRLVDDGLHGVTSNPSIFEKAIGHSDEYDEAIGSMLHIEDRSPGELYECLAVEDIKHAADILRPVFDTTHGADGFVSIEVSPHIAMDTQRTIAEAKRLWSEIDRRNLMVKVPGTSAGLPAIHALTAEGINVNITLLFSRKVYERVVEAYMSGLEERAVKGGDPSPVASVASFFVSRIDTAVDKLLDEKIAKTNDPSEKARLGDLKGKTAIANAKLAYQTYKQLFAGERWKALRANGARPQRLLWASTGTKNKAYSDTLYVDELIGLDTVNTMPPATLDAFRSHGVLRDSLEENVEDAQRILGDIGRAGISLDAVTDRLVEEGVGLFADATDKLLGAVAKKRMAVLGERVDAQTLTLGARVETAAGEIEEEWRAKGLVRRLWRRDKALWTNADEDQWLGWLDSVEGNLKQVGAIPGVRRGDKGRRLQGCRAARHGWFQSRARGPGADAGRQVRMAETAYPRLHRSGADRCDPKRRRSRQDAVHRIEQVGQHHRTEPAEELFPELRCRCDRSRRSRPAIRRRHRSGLAAGRDGEGRRLPSHFLRHPQHRRPLFGAFRLRPRAGRCDGNRRRVASARRSDDGAILRSRCTAGAQTPACGSASPWARPDWTGATR